MTAYYVYSGAGGGATGADWANAYTSLVTAISGKTAGDIFYIAHDHVQAAVTTLTLTSPGTNAAPCLFLCVNRAGSVPPVAADLTTGATFTTSGAPHTININGTYYYYGCSFIQGLTTAGGALNICNTTPNTGIFENCVLGDAGTGISAINLGSASNPAPGSFIRFINTGIQQTGLDAIHINCCVEWIKRPGSAAFLGPTYQTNQFNFASGGSLLMRGLDLNSLSGKILSSGSLGGVGTRYVIEDCRLPASVTVSSAPDAPGRPQTELIRSDSAATNYRYEKPHADAMLTTDTTILRTGGASNGTPFTWKVITTAQVKLYRPYECPVIAAWCSTSGSSITATVECVWGTASAPYDDEIWLEIQYLGDAAYPVAHFANDGKVNILSTRVVQSDSEAEWNGSTYPFKLEVTFAPQMAGWVYAVVKVAKASSTFYIDPKLTLTAAEAGETGADLAAAVIPFTQPASTTGTQDITASAFGGGTPTLAMFVNSGASSVKSDVANAQLGFGATDGSSQFASDTLSTDNSTAGAGVDTVAGATDKALTLVGPTLILMESSFSTFLTNGVRINCTNAVASDLRQTAIALGGADLTVKVGTVTPTTGSGAAVSLGWRPDAIIFQYSDAAFSDTVLTAFRSVMGFAAWDSGAVLAEVSAGVRADTGSTRLYRTFVANDCCMAGISATADSFPWKVNVTRSASGFTATATATSVPIGYIALKIDGGRAKAGTWTLPTGTGSASKAGVGFKPRLVMLCGTERTAIGGPSSGTLFGMAAMAREPKAASLFGAWVSDSAAQGGGAPSDTKHTVDNDGLYGLLNTGSADFDMELTSLDDDGWTVNVTDAPAGAYLWSYLAIG